MQQVYFEERTAHFGDAAVQALFDEQHLGQEGRALAESEAHRVPATDRNEDVAGFRRQAAANVDFEGSPLDYLLKARRNRAGQHEQEPEMRVATGILGMVRRWGGEFGPYLMLEILLPGGSLLALLLFLHRRKSLASSRNGVTAVTGRWAPWLFDSTGRLRLRLQRTI